VSLRSDILGWVIRRLSEIDAIDDHRRANLFSSLRDEVRAQGFAGTSPADALPHLESAIRRQEAHWLLAAPRESYPEVSDSAEPRPATPQKTSWKWPKGAKPPKKVPGPAPGEPVGPFSDHVYSIVDLMIPGGTARLTVGWALDPACVLSATCSEIGFRFSTRAADFASAIDHLEAALRSGGLELPVELRPAEP